MTDTKKEKSDSLKNTLNLPYTEFPMKANLSSQEPKMLARWAKIDIYSKILEKNLGKPDFILHDGPPYANGDLHLGHAINKSLKDFVVKSKSMSGFNSPFVPGWDCHGLPIEHNVEKKKGKAGQKISHAAFREECRKYATTQVEKQKIDFVRLGVFADWEKPYLTMDFKTEANIVRSLGVIVDRGHLVKGYKPVYWSVVGGSALAEAEVEYQEKESYAIDVRFKPTELRSFLSKFSVSDGDAKGKDVSVVIWTTTPWTLPSNQAVCLNKDLRYALLDVQVGFNREYIVISKDMINEVMSRYKCNSFKLVGECVGAELEGEQLYSPLTRSAVPVILGEHVTTEAGTGCVHTAPDHGVDDFNVAKKYGIDTLNLIDSGGVFSAAAGEFGGLHVYKVDSVVIDRLKTENLLIKEEKINHSYAHCWRTKTPLIYRATPQWFISMQQEGLLDESLIAADKVTWVPDWGKARIELMLKGSPDWCVSRQRSWGVPITLFVHKETGDLHPNTASLIEEIAQRIERSGIEAWFDLDSAELIGDDSSDYEKVTDTLDVWFDSGVSHYSVLSKRDNLKYPADLYLEGSDQHRGWFQSSLKTAVAMNGTAPYRQVLTHGFFVDAEGKKMSKSLGNTVAPQKIFKEQGADILRLWVAATDYRGEMTVSDEIFKRIADSYRRIRNTARFMLSNLNGFDPAKDSVESAQMLSLDSWILRQCRELESEVCDHYSSYNFHHIYQRVHNFCVSELGGFYLDVIKDRQYTCQSDSLARRSTQTVLLAMTEMLSRMIAPILSFTADEIWQYIPGERSESVFLSNFGDSKCDVGADSDEFNDAYWRTLIDIRTVVNKELEQKRADKEIKANLSAEVDLYCTAELAEKLRWLGDELRFVLIVSKATIHIGNGKDSTGTDVEGLRLLVRPSSKEKCERCWHHRQDVGSNIDYPNLCGRCISNIHGEGELRRFA
jgi:isoleucyl-tRNA synthetase